MKAYTYRGYEFHTTDTTTDKRVYHGDRLHHTELRNTYQITDRETGEVIKSCMTRPFLTSARECREYIDEDM